MGDAVQERGGEERIWSLIEKSRKKIERQYYYMGTHKRRFTRTGWIIKMGKLLLDGKSNIR